MPFNLDFSSSRNALARLSQFMQYDMLQRRGAERQQKQALLENALMTGRQREGFEQDVALEGYRSENTMAEAKNAALLAIAQKPQFDAMVAFLNLGKMGKLGPEDQPMYEDAKARFGTMLERMANAAYDVSTGKAKPESFAALIESTGGQAAEWASKELGTNLRAKDQLKVDMEKNRIAAIQAGNEQAGLVGKLTDQQKAAIEQIDKAQAHIIGQGVVAAPGALAELTKMFSAATGRAFDTYNSDVAGQLKSGLDEIKTQIITKGILPNDIQNRFINQTYNAFQYRRPETGETAPEPAKAPSKSAQKSSLNKNVPSPVTGLSEVETEQAKTRARESDVLYYINYYLTRTNPGRDPVKDPWTPEELAKARMYAEEWVDQINKKRP